MVSVRMATVAMAQAPQSSQINDINDQIAALLRVMQQEGIMDEQFEQLLLLQDEAEPDFVQTVMELFLQDAMAAINRIHTALMEPVPDFVAVDQVVHQLKGSSASFGALAISQVCIQLRMACKDGDKDSGLRLVQHVAGAYEALQNRLHTFAQLETAKKALMAQPR